jgi:hypothetical protein
MGGLVGTRLQQGERLAQEERLQQRQLRQQITWERRNDTNREGEEKFHKFKRRGASTTVGFDGWWTVNVSFGQMKTFFHFEPLPSECENRWALLRHFFKNDVKLMKMMT